MKSAGAYTMDLFDDSRSAVVAPDPDEKPDRVPTISREKFYYNTTRAKGSELAQARRKASTQEDIIKHYFLANPWAIKGPSQLSALIPNAPLTSVRRSITNLTNKRVLVKTGQQRQGLFGRMEYLWKLNPNHGRESL